MNRFIPARKQPVTNLQHVVDCLRSAFVKGQAYSFQAQLEASRFLRNEIVSKGEKGSYVYAFAESVHHLGWIAPQWIFGDGTYKNSVFLPSTAEID